MTSAPLPAGRLWLAGLGMVLVQLAWVLVLPAYAGIDEFDHSYRASGVANGQWLAEPSAATRGTGAWVHAETDIVEAARVECQSLKYTTDADCVGTPLEEGRTRIASGAGRYNPVFYALIGYPALPFEGRAALYVMRGAAALLCTGLFMAGLFALRRIARTPWAWVGAAAAITPVVSYSTAVAAPNGAEIMAGFAFWAGCLALLRSERGEGRFWVSLVVATVGGMTLVTFRSLGPMWCLLISLGVLASVPGAWRNARALVRRTSVRISTVLIGLATAAAVLWTRAMGSLVVGVEDVNERLSASDRLTVLASDVPLWVFQSIAAFPYRNEMAPLPVYGIYLALFLVVVGVGIARGSFRWAIGLGGIAVVALLVPAIVSYSTMETYTRAWQGRYGLPFAIGLVLVAGVAVASFRHRFLPHVLGGLASVALAISVLSVRSQKVSTVDELPSGSWWVPPVALVLALAVLGTVLTWSLAMNTRRST